MSLRRLAGPRFASREPEQPVEGDLPSPWVVVAVLALVVSAGASAFSTLSADTDLWGHLRFGKAHWESGSLDRTDPYAFTSGEIWINHEWLSELVFWLAYGVGGDLGLAALKTGVGLLMLGLLAGDLLLRRASPLATGLVLVLASYAMAPGFMFRPQVFSYLLFAIVVIALRAWYRGVTASLVLLPVVMLLWANLHGGFLMGGAAIAVAVVTATAVGIRLPTQRGRLGWLWIAAATGAAATLANPFGLDLHRFLARSLSMHRPIGEWAPLPWDGSFPEIKIMLGLTVVVGLWLIRRRRIVPAELAVVALTAVATVTHQRHAPFFVIASAPVLIDGLGSMLRRWLEPIEKPRHPSAATRVIVAAVLLLAAAQTATAWVAVSSTGGRIYVDPELYPVQATGFLTDQRGRGRLLVSFEWGEYAIWHLWPGCTVSIDGRFRTVYPERVLMDHHAAAVDPAHWAVLLDVYDPDLAMIPRSPEVDAMARRPPPGWITVWADPLAVVLARHDGSAGALADAFASRGPALPSRPPEVFFP